MGLEPKESRVHESLKNAMYEEAFGAASVRLACRGYSAHLALTAAA